METGWQPLRRVLEPPGPSDDNDVPMMLEVATPTSEQHPPEEEDHAADPHPGAPKVTLRNLLQHPATDPVVLGLLALRRLGPEWLAWEPETTEHALSRAFGHNMSDLCSHKLQALRCLHTVDTPWVHWEVFSPVIATLSGIIPDFTHMQVPNTWQCLFGVDVMDAVRKDVEWSLEVKTFMACTLLHDSVLVPPDSLHFVPMDVEGYPVDVAKVRATWPSVKAARKPVLPSTVEGAQLNRLLELELLLRDAHAAREQQMELLNV